MKNVNVSVDFTKIVGKMKPMHGVGQPPRVGNSDTMYHYLTEAGIPYARLHDVGGWLGGGLYVDVPNLFRDFNADENDPNSYDFAFTDKLIAGLMRRGASRIFVLASPLKTNTSSSPTVFFRRRTTGSGRGFASISFATTKRVGQTAILTILPTGKSGMSPTIVTITKRRQCGRVRPSSTLSCTA